VKHHPDNLLHQVAQAEWIPRQHCQSGMSGGTDTPSDLVRTTERTRLGAHPGAIFFFRVLPWQVVSIRSRQPDGCDLQIIRLHLNPKRGAQTAPRKSFITALLRVGTTVGTKVRAIRTFWVDAVGNLASPKLPPEHACCHGTVQIKAAISRPAAVGHH
jgi:hypothetical protein